MEELDLVAKPDSDLNKELAPYPLPTTYAESIFKLDMHNLPDRVTKYGNYCWHIKDVFKYYDQVYDFVRTIPYTYFRELNASAYLYRSQWTLPPTYTQCVNGWLSEVTDLPNSLEERQGHSWEWISSFFTKAWYDMHYIEMSPHQDNEAGGMFDLNRPVTQGNIVDYVVLIYMNDGFGTSLYSTYEKDHAKLADIEAQKFLVNFNFINLKHREDWREHYKEVLTSPGQKNSAFIFPANCPHRVSRYKEDTPVAVFEAEGRFYLMQSFKLHFI